MVKKLDDSVGTVISALQRKGMLENSIIIFMSDNGAPTVEYRETSNYRNWGSNYPYRGVSILAFIRTPTLVDGFVPLFVFTKYIENEKFSITVQ